MNEELNRCASRQKRFFILHSSFYIQGARRAGFLVAAFFILHSSFFIPRVSAQNFIPQGGEHAPAGNLPGDQTFPQLSIASSGGFIVWQDNATDGNNGLGISAQRLNSSLTQSGAPFRVNAQKTGDQEKPKVSLLNDGRAVFVWQGGKYGFQKIYARFLAPDGSFVARDVLVNTYKGGFQINPAVATLADGSVVIVWSSFEQDGNLQGIFGQRFSATGAKLGGEFQVNQWTAGNQRTPAVAALANGNFLVVWVSELQRGSASVDVYGRIFNSSGVATGGEFPVNASAANLCANPSVAGSPQGGFAVAWSQNDNVTLGAGGNVTSVQSVTRSTNSWDVFGRLFDADGTTTTAPVRLNTTTYGDQYAPKINALGGDYLAVWSSLGQDGSREGVYGRFLADNGDFTGPEFRVNTATVSRQIDPAVAADGVNRFLVGWSSFVGGVGSFDSFAQKYLKTVVP